MELDLSRVVRYASSRLGVQIESQHEVYQHETSDPAEDLQEAGVIPTTESDTHVITLAGTDTVVATVRVVLFRTTEVAYIQDVVVREEFREMGIGSMLFKSVVESIPRRDIYSYPSNSIMTRILEESGFSPTADGPSGWYSDN